MRRQKRSIWSAAIAAAGLWIHCPPLNAAVMQQPYAQAKAIAPNSTIPRTHLFEPLIATGATTPAEDSALSQSLIANEKRVKPDNFSNLTDFVTHYPHSGWRTAVEANLGLLYLHYGYFSKALDAFQAAWDAGKNATGWQARALVDDAVGQLAWLEASLGRTDQLKVLLDELQGRPIKGSATERVQFARTILTKAEKDPRHLFLCGPIALSSLMLDQGAHHEQVRFVHTYRAAQNGTSLAQLAALADQEKFPYQLVFRKPGQNVPIPSVVHWKVGHFATILGKAYGYYRVQDAVFPAHEIWVSQGALDSEASGYFLVAGAPSGNTDWRKVDLTEAATVWGKGPTNGTQQGGVGPQQDPQTPANPNNCSSCSCSGMCGYTIGESTVSVTLSDTPVGYQPPIGPSVKTTLTYNAREDDQTAFPGWFNVSQKWTLNWLSYVTDEPNIPGADVSRYLPGGGTYYYSGYNSSSGQFTPQNNDASVLVLTSMDPIIYQRRLKDGSVEVYAQSDGATNTARNIFLSKIIDPQGNALTFSYDSNMRLLSITDATGRVTTLSYEDRQFPELVTKITDPFGRRAVLNYNGDFLSSITDTLGLTSTFGYDFNALVDSMTTPYGTTNFSYTSAGASGPPLFVDVEDPLGYHERVEWLEPAPISDSDPAATVPQGMPISLTNQWLEYRDSFYWDRDAYIQAGCSPTGGCDYTLAKDIHFNHVPPNTSIKSTSIESIKNPLENRIWYVYPGQTISIYGGTYEKPIAAGRVLDDGSTQLTQYSYDPVSFNLTQTIDPLGRTTTFTYANHIDLSAVTQSVSGSQQLLAQFTYNAQHRPLVYTDAAAETTFYTYNAAGQLTSLTNPLGQKTQYQYNSTGDLTTIVNANNATAASFTYDSYDRIATYTDSEGWTVSYNYDNADRVTKITYPDGTADIYTYDKLDLASYQDRQGRQWVYTHDADRRLTSITDPTGGLTQFGYNGKGQVTSLTDPKGNVTSWTYDVEGRLTSKQYADKSAIAYTYETTTSRLKSISDALSQVKQFAYAEDDRLLGITYSNAANPTPNVAFAYDAYFPRLAAMTDGNGTTQYAYVPVGSLGALQVQQEASPLASSSIAYVYDELGRLASQTVAGAGGETYQYDAIGRLISDTNDLGAFSLAYLGQTSQITTRQLAGSTLATSWSYLPNSGDRRLAGINNVGLSSSQYSTYQYTTTPENFISSIAESSDAASVAPGALTQSASYNNLNQLTNLSGQALSFDANGNLLSDGQRNYSWDAENRLVGITYPSQSGKATTFTYDGLSRRTAITSTPAGGGTATTTSYIWCGTSICQARNSAGATTREYYTEGEFVPGSPAQPYYYGVDQIGSVRRAFASTSSAPAFGYDAYGNALQTTAPVTDFNYAGMFYNADSGLNLTQYRAYDPVGGRWLSRDPLGESASLTNLYAYVGGNPINKRDEFGLWTINIGISGNVNIPIIGQIGIGGGGYAGIVYDGTTLAWYYGGGGGIGGGAGGSIGIQIGSSNANTVCDLRGPFLSASASGGEGVIGGGEIYYGQGSNGAQIIGGNLFVGAGAGTPIAGTGGVTYTYIKPW
jgi:RHS repeat-associated protein